MNIRGIIVVAGLAVVPIGCASSAAPPAEAPSSMTIRTTPHPQILQNSSQWIGLTPNLTDQVLVGITAGSDGAMWTFSGFQGARYTMTQALKKFTLNVTGPNGPGTQFAPDVVVRAGTNVYANGSDPGFGGVAVFGVITPKRVVNVYSIPSGDQATFNGVAYDPANQSVWFGEDAHIAKVDVATNAITEFPTNNDIAAVAYGPDGDIWTFSTGTQEQLLVFDPTTGVQVASYPFTCGVLHSLVAGADGNLYGAGAGCGPGSFLAKITTGGVVTRIPLPATAAASPVDIALVGVGADAGHVVVQEADNDNFDDYDPTTGVVTQILAPPQYAGDFGSSITAGPDGNIWATDFEDDVLVYVVDLITANPTSITVNVGQSVKLTASEPDKARLKATSSNTGVATVTKVAGGYSVAGVSAGTCTITLKDNIFNTLKVPVTVQ